VYSVSTSTLHISRNTKIYSVQCKLRFSWRNCEFILPY
jgi:hypothetical protein